MQSNFTYLVSVLVLMYKVSSLLLLWLLRELFSGWVELPQDLPRKCHSLDSVDPSLP